MEIAIFYLLFTALFICVLWAGTRILQKAGLRSSLSTLFIDSGFEYTDDLGFCFL